VEVTLVEKAGQVLPPLDPEMAVFVANALQEMGARVIVGDGIAAFEPGKVRLESGLELEAELFILGLGVRPDTRLARAAGLAIGASGAIAVDDHMRTSDPDIYAAGDAVETVNLVTGAPGWMPLAGPANKQGRVAGANAAGDDLTFPGALGTAIVRVGSTVAAATGLSAKAARQAGLDFYVSYTVSGDHADYYPGAQEILTKLVIERGTGRLLGAQVIGAGGVDKRTDVLATAIAGRMAVEDLTNLDLAYAPPFGAAKDPVIVAGMVGENILRGKFAVTTADALARRLAAGEPLQVVDVREPYEWEIQSIPGSVNIPHDSLRARLAELDPTLPTVVYDQHGKQGYWAARILLQHGFADVTALAGGMTLWSAHQAMAL